MGLPFGRISIALNPLGYALVGPLAAASSPETVLIGAAALMTVSTTVVLAIPSMHSLRTTGPLSEA